MRKFIKTNRGFVVLFTVLISSIVLAIAIGISTIALGEVTLSASAKEGNIAFYAADTGIECALYHDIKNDQNPFEDNGTFSCAEDNTNSLGEIIIDGKSGFELDLNPDKNGNAQNCARVTVNKEYSEGDLCNENPFCTRIKSLGYNVPCDAVETGEPRETVRALRATYKNP